MYTPQPKYTAASNVLEDCFMEYIKLSHDLIVSDLAYDAVRSSYDRATNFRMAELNFLDNQNVFLVTLINFPRLQIELIGVFYFDTNLRIAL